MARPDHSIRGARDLAALWGELPTAVWVFPLRELPDGVGVLALNNALRTGAWRTFCAARQSQPCVVASQDCAVGGCLADRLFPRVAGTAPQWRMATLWPLWRPEAQTLALLALGEATVSALPWAARHLRRRFALPAGHAETVCRLADWFPTQVGYWRLTTVTPWVVGKGRTALDAPRPTPTDVQARLTHTLSARAHKLTALCSADPAWQRLGGHLARYVTAALLSAGALTVTEASLEPLTLEAARLGRNKPYDAHAWGGSVTVTVQEPALPWLGLLTLFGVGENADKGFGQLTGYRPEDR